MMEDLRNQVPAKLRDRLAEIVAITDRFCAGYLNEEYRRLCREMAAVVCQQGLPVTSGKALGWAGGIISTLGWINFLGDPSQEPHMRTDDVARALGVSPATMAAKAKVIRERLRLRRMDPNWSTGRILEHNPLVWLLPDKHGLFFDVRQAPRAVQEEAYRRGLIPFIPDDRAGREINDEEDEP